MNFRFNNLGLLPPKDYQMTFAQLRSSLLVVGPGKKVEPDWDTSWRFYLVDQLEILVNQLWQIGVADIFVDGSFVEQKNHPNDIDGYFHCDATEFARGNIARALNRLDPHKIWTWDRAARRPYKGYPKKQLPMWHRYRVELYPHFDGLLSGIKDKFGNELQFPSAFRQCRANGDQKGIVQIVSG